MDVFTANLLFQIIQSATNKWRKVPAKYTKPSPYPVALIHGQFQNYYRKYVAHIFSQVIVKLFYWRS